MCWLLLTNPQSSVCWLQDCFHPFIHSHPSALFLSRVITITCWSLSSLDICLVKVYVGLMWSIFVPLVSVFYNVTLISLCMINYYLNIKKNAPTSSEAPSVFRILGNDPPWLWSGSWRGSLRGEGRCRSCMGGLVEDAWTLHWLHRECVAPATQSPSETAALLLAWGSSVSRMNSWVAFRIRPGGRRSSTHCLGSWFARCGEKHEMGCLLKCPCNPDWKNRPQTPDSNHWSQPHSPPWRRPRPLSALCSLGRCGSQGAACHSLISVAWHQGRKGCVWDKSDRSACWIGSAFQSPSPHLWRAPACWDRERSPCWRCPGHTSSASSNDWIRSPLGRWGVHCQGVWSCLLSGGGRVDFPYGENWSVSPRCCQTPPEGHWWMRLWAAGSLEQ